MMRLVLLVFPFGYLFGRWVDGLDLVHDIVGMRVCFISWFPCEQRLIKFRIVEYATRDQAQQAIQSLSNQSLMGRLVYVREVS